MDLRSQGIEGFSGATAVGALTLIGLILTANAFATNLFPAIDYYARTPTWAIVVAFPLVALSYLLGLLSTGIAEVALTRLRLVNADALIEDVIRVSSHGAFVVSRFNQLRQEAELLAGSATALGLVAIGSALSAWATEGWRRFLVAATIATIVLAIGSIALSRARHGSAHRLAIRAKSEEGHTNV